MTRYVIDAPTLLHLATEELKLDGRHQLVAPGSIRSEALELLLVEVARGVRTEKAALQCHERMTEIKIRVLGDRVSRRTAWRIARQQGWDTLRDAEYLAVTRLQADALVTLDAELARKAEPLVPLATLADLLSEAAAAPRATKDVQHDGDDHDDDENGPQHDIHSAPGNAR